VLAGLQEVWERELGNWEGDVVGAWEAHLMELGGSW